MKAARLDRFAQILVQDNFLVLATLVYIQIPAVIFLSSWLRWYFSLVALVLLFIANKRVLYQYKLYELDIKNRITAQPAVFLFCLFIMLGWLALSGVGGVGFQNTDYPKHTAFLHDLVALTWPLTYQVQGYGQSEFHAVYYMAWYLPAALIGKLWGFKAALVASFLWTFIGLGLVLCWLFNLARRASPGIVLIFVFFSGLDFFGYILVNQALPNAADHLEWWAGFWQFSSNTSLLFWVPQHALPGWLMTFVFIKLLQRGRTEFLFFLLAPVLLWSPFVALGLLPLAVVGTFNTGVRSALNSTNSVIALVLGLMLCVFLMAKLPDSYAGLILTTEQRSGVLPVLWLFLLLEVGIFLLFLIDEINGLGNALNKALWASVVFLLALLPVRYGLYNDLAMRASIPALTVLCLAMIRHFSNREDRSAVLDKILVLLLLLGALNPLQEIVRSVARFDWPDFDAQHVPDLEMKVARQYIAPSDSLFFTYLARGSNPLVIELGKELLNELEGRRVLIK